MAENLKTKDMAILTNAAAQCATCKNRNGRTLTCKAFPRGIPMEILRGRHDHKEPYPRDNGIRYDPIDPEHPQEAPYKGKPMY